MQDCEQYTTGRRNTLATQTGEVFIQVGEGNTGENNQGLGMIRDTTRGRASDLKQEESYFSK